MTSTKETFIGALVFLACLLAGATLSITFFSPSRFEQEAPWLRDYDPAALREATAPDAVESLRAALDGLGPRVLGQPALEAAGDFIRAHYEAYGLDIYELQGETAALVTRQRSLAGADGTPLAGVEIYPFPPNYLQPVATPATGITGTLKLIDEQTIREASSFAGYIGVVRTDSIPHRQGLDWTRYAQLGLKGLILVAPDGIDDMPWVTIHAEGALRNALPVNFPRLAANAALLDHLGADVRLDVTVRFERVPTRTLIGVQRAPAPAREAMVVNVAYDQYGLLPDYGVSSLQTYPLALHLALVQGLAPYTDELQRDIIFVASSAQGAGFACLDHLLRMLGPAFAQQPASARIDEQLHRHRARSDTILRIQAALDRTALLDDVSGTLALHRDLTSTDRRFFDQQLNYTLNTLVFDQTEPRLQARITYERGDRLDLTHPAYLDYLREQRIYDDMAAAAGLSLGRLMERMAIGVEPPTRFVDHYRVADRFQARLTELRAYHQAQEQIWSEGRVLHDLFSAYLDVTVFHPAFIPSIDDAGDTVRRLISFVPGGPAFVNRRVSDAIGPGLIQSLDSTIQRVGLGDRLGVQSPVGQSPGIVYRTTHRFPSAAANWTGLGYRAFSLINTDRATAYRALTLPPDPQRPPHAAQMATSLDFAGQFLLAFARGAGRLAVPPKLSIQQFSGNVYVSDVGRSLIPNYPLANALIKPMAREDLFGSRAGRIETLVHFTDPYGRYELPDTSSFMLPRRYNLQVARYDEQGQLTHVKDESRTTQNLYRSVDLDPHNRDFRHVNLVAFRATPVAVLDLINPQTLRPFTSVSLLRQGSLTGFARHNTVETEEGQVTFIPPESYFIATFRAGTPDNELVQTVRSFMGGDPVARAMTGSAISGAGYLAQDHPILLDATYEQARSMNRLNNTRITLQQARGLTDRHTVEFHEQSAERLRAVDDSAPSQSWLERLLAARDSLTYSIIVHPILRGNINEAVISILWYMGLLVPFMFFFEKLAFGFSDIRKQLAAQAVIFLVVFVLLRLLHPAFEMIRSSLMILLGFVILLISLGITALFAGKFHENLEEIKQRRGQVTAAEVNTMGVIATAFMLGLNNMHRRKVRTGLTCATLVLITFAMICFTSIYSDFEDTEITLGRASYQGLLIKNEQFGPISATELFALEERYGHRFAIAPRFMYVGQITGERELVNPDLEIMHVTDGARTRVLPFGSIIRLAPHEPLRQTLRFVSEPYWFDPAEWADPAAPLAVIIPASMAERLGIRIAAVNDGGALVRINGSPFLVRGVFDEESYYAMHDLDGRPILPFDAVGLRDVQLVPGSTRELLADEDGYLMEPGDIVLAPSISLGLDVSDANDRLVSITIDLGGLAFREARQEVVQFLEQRARPAFYGLDNTAYRGSRMRVSSFAGLVDLVIPLIIAALTVLNTMKGSVYERRDEIYVYNAVGIAPKFIFFMFFAEAFVYAVVGSVLGYLLSQGTGTILTALDLTGGLNMTFASVNSIYASLAVVAAVFISTYFPAKSAVEIAAPAEESGWDMPEPEGDTLTFDLPFTFDQRERIAVLAFFHRHLLDHGEGGAGGFAAGVPRFQLRGDAGGGAKGVVPALAAMIWLQPYDLGVSQQLCIETPLDDETGEFIACLRLTRVSGTQEAWRRVNHRFMASIRRQFLHWRAVAPAQKQELFAEARAQIEATGPQEHTPHG